MKQIGMIILVLGMCMSFSNYGLAEEKGLAGYWKFDETKGDIAKDSSGKNNHGKIQGSAWIKGKIGNALTFDGIDDYVNCGNNESLNITDAITIEVWVKTPTPMKDWQTIVGGNGYSQLLRFNSTIGRIEFYTWNSDNITKRAVSTTVCSPDTWYHVAGTYDKDAGSNNLKLYINGILEDEETQTLSLKPMTSREIGRDSNHLYFNGTIDEVRIYDRALTAEEIKNHYEKMLYVVSPIEAGITAIHPRRIKKICQVLG